MTTSSNLLTIYKKRTWFTCYWNSLAMVTCFFTFTPKMDFPRKWLWNSSTKLPSPFSICMIETFFIEILSRRTFCLTPISTSSYVTWVGLVSTMIKVSDRAFAVHMSIWVLKSSSKNNTTAKLIFGVSEFFSTKCYMEIHPSRLTILTLYNRN